MNETNIIITNAQLRKNRDLIPRLFGTEPITYLPARSTMYDALVAAGIFPSKQQAKQNWTTTGKAIPPGFTDYPGIGKYRKRLTIWKPITKRSALTIE